jgi:hypothetical protein
MARSTSRASQNKEVSETQPPASGFNYCRCTVPRGASPPFVLPDGSVPRAGRSSLDEQRLSVAHAIRVTKPGTITPWHYVNDAAPDEHYRGKRRFLDRTPPLQSAFDPSRQGPPFTPPHRLPRKAVESHIDLSSGADQGDAMRFGKRVVKPVVDRGQAAKVSVDRAYHPITPWYSGD